MSDAVATSVLTLPAWSKRFKKILLIGAAVFTLLIAAILALPQFVDLGRFKRTYLPLVEEALGRRVDVGEVHLNLFPAPSIRLSKLKVFDRPTFADNQFFSAQLVELKLRLLPLLRGRFEVTELVLEKPIFNVLKQPDGSFNYSDIASSKKTPIRRDPKKKPDGGKVAEHAPLVIPGRVRIRGGELNLITKGQRAVNIQGIELFLQEPTVDAPFPFRASFQYAGLKTVSLEGELDYQEEKALLVLKNNQLKIQELSFPVHGSVSNLSTTPRVDLTVNNDNVDAKPIFQILSTFGMAPRDTEVSGPMALHMSVAGPSNALVTQVRGIFKQVKVHGKRAVKGTLTGDVSLRLPLGGGAIARRLQGSGKLIAHDGELTNVSLIKKIQRITGMIGMSKDDRREATTFKTLEAEFTVGGGSAEFTRLYLINPQMEVTGNGFMTIEQPTLDMWLTTALSSQAAAQAGRGRAAALLKDRQGRIVVPLRVTGPVENPTVNLHTEKLAETGLPRNVEKGFSSFFKGLFRNR